MARLKSCSDEELTPALVARLETHTGSRKIAPVFREMGNSPVALDAYLTLEQSLSRSTLTTREIEAVKLLVSQINRCDFCLSVHTVKSKAAGIEQDEQLAIRRLADLDLSEQNGIDDARLVAILNLVVCFFRHPGPVDKAILDEAREAGLNDANLMDIVAAVSTIFLTNVFNHINDTELVYAKAAEL